MKRQDIAQMEADVSGVLDKYRDKEDVSTATIAGVLLTLAVVTVHDTIPVESKAGGAIEENLG